MRKKYLKHFAIVSLITAFTAFSVPEMEPVTASQEETTVESESNAFSFDLSAAGVGFDLPEEMQEMKGLFLPSYGTEVESGSGIWLSGMLYFAFPQEKYDELEAKGNNLTEEDIEFLRQRMIDIFLVYTIDGNRTVEDVTDTLAAYGLPIEGLEEIGSVADEYRYYYLVNPMADILDENFTFDEGFREEYERAIQICEDPYWIRMYEPISETAALIGTALSFETTDLDGNVVHSSDIFSKNKITMVNLWGTYCGPCINEMPDLEILNQRLAGKGCGIVGVVLDVGGLDDSSQISKAKTILGDAGVTYLNLLPWDGIWTDLPAQAIPTSYFVDSEGRIIGEPAVGARGADEYEALFE